MFLMVYHSEVYKEISLSGIDNSDYEVSLDASEFQMSALPRQTLA